jgi:hypothetical protein
MSPFGALLPNVHFLILGASLANEKKGRRRSRFGYVLALSIYFHETVNWKSSAAPENAYEKLSSIIARPAKLSMVIVSWWKEVPWLYHLTTMTMSEAVALPKLTTVPLTSWFRMLPNLSSMRLALM